MSRPLACTIAAAIAVFAFSSEAVAQSCGCSGAAAAPVMSAPVMSAPVMSAPMTSTPVMVDYGTIPAQTMQFQTGPVYNSPVNSRGFYSSPGYVIDGYRPVQASREVRAFPRTPYSSPPFFRASTNLPARSQTIYGHSLRYQAIPGSGCGCGR